MKNNITAVGEILFDIYPDEKRLGGAPFNFIYHIWKILGKANFISSVGNDDNGNEMLGYLNTIGFNTSNIKVDNDFSTGTVLVKIDENKIPHYSISSECSFDNLSIDDKTKKVLDDETDLLYFGTFTMRKEFSRNTLVSLFNNPNKKYFCDLNLRHKFFSRELIEVVLHTCNLIKINLDELNLLKEIFNLDGENHAAVNQLIRQFNIEMAAVTLGEDGAELFTPAEINFYKPGADDIVDTLGAGDAFSAILCLGYLRNMPLNEINKLANEFALSICKIYGALPTIDSIYDPFIKVFRDK